MKLLFFLLLVKCVQPDAQYNENLHWTFYKLDRPYSSSKEIAMRNYAFLGNWAHIDSTIGGFNQRINLIENITYHIRSIQQWLDLTPEETYKKFAGDDDQTCSIPETYDLKIKPVGNQGNINAAWAFTATYTLETAIFQETNGNTRILLSDQYFINCVRNTVVNPLLVWQRIATTYAVEEKYMPFNGIMHECGRTECRRSVFQIVQVEFDVYMIETHDVASIQRALKLDQLFFINVEQAEQFYRQRIQKAILSHGAPTVLISSAGLKGHRRGEVFCPKTFHDTYDYYMNIVGWDTTDPENPHWILRDSNGDKIFEGGYLKLNMHCATNVMKRESLWFIRDVKFFHKRNDLCETQTDGLPSDFRTTVPYLPTALTGNQTEPECYDEPIGNRTKIVVKARGEVNPQTVYLEANGKLFEIELDIRHCHSRQKAKFSADTDIFEVYIYGLAGYQQYVSDSVLMQENVGLKLIKMTD